MIKQSTPITTHCMACNSTHLESQFIARSVENRPFHYMRCQACNTLQIAAFDDHLLREAYSASYYGGDDQKFKWPFSSLFNLGKLMAAKNTRKLINKDAHILDIGCGKGDFLQKLHGLGHKNLWGNDINRPKHLPSYITWIPGNFPHIEVPNRQFDLITLVHVFEHLPDPQQVVKKLSELIKPGGLVQLSQPSVESTQAQKYQAAWLHLDPPRHLHLIPSAQLERLFQQAGFELTSKNYDSTLYNPFGYLQSWLNKSISQRDLLYEFLKKGGKANGMKQVLQLILSFIFAGISFPFYLIMSKIESKKGKAGTVEFVFRRQSAK